MITKWIDLYSYLFISIDIFVLVHLFIYTSINLSIYLCMRIGEV